MTASFHPPPEDLAADVESLWVGRWDIREGNEHTTELLGDPCMHLAFERRGEFVEARLVGVWTKLWRRKLAGCGFVRAAKLRPGSAALWWDAPAAAFTNRITPLDAVLSTSAGILRHQVLAPESDVDGLSALVQWLRANRRSERSAEARLAQKLVEHVRSNPELTRAEELARAAGLGLRALQQLFRAHVGASPKWLIRRFRLQEVATQLEHQTHVHLARLAAQLGYADQAHLTRDFKAATGKTPVQFLTSVRGKRRHDRT